MTPISSSSSIQAAQRSAAAPAGRAAAAPAAPIGPSSFVRLGAGGLAAARQAAADADLPGIPAAVRYKDLGATVLEALAAGPVATTEQVPAEVDNTFSLEIVTASGKQVALTLANRDDQMFVSVDADPDLSGAEREALSGLAEGWQDAIDGMAQAEPRVRLAKLAGLDGTVLQSIAFRAAVTLPTAPPEQMSLDLRIDEQQRSVNIDGPRGKIGLSVDTSQLQLMGSRQQQAKAIDHYLEQADAAAQRGHGDAGLVGMFKAAFSDLSRTSVRDDAAPASGGGWSLAKQDRAVLSGLSDFRATVEQAAQRINPARRDEVDGFRYEISQQSSIGGDSFADRALAQQQHSHLSAQFHEPLRPGGILAFDFRSETQNYRYHQIDDAASARVELGYKDGRLHKAGMEQTVDQSERVRKYVLGRAMSDRTTPDRHSLMRDLVATLAPYRPRQDGSRHDSREAKEAERQLSLDALRDDMLLLGTRLALGERDAGLGEQAPV